PAKPAHLAQRRHTCGASAHGRSAPRASPNPLREPTTENLCLSAAACGARRQAGFQSQPRGSARGDRRPPLSPLQPTPIDVIPFAVPPHTSFYNIHRRSHTLSVEVDHVASTPFFVD
ncbi:MAG: hypothetical protein KGY78_09860, partial [Anaerolineae bacterium]|nr:hypothetical protein [Anaerolineae bacterium]